VPARLCRRFLFFSLFLFFFTELDPNSHEEATFGTRHLAAIRVCELIIDNLLYRALRHQHFASLTGLSAWSGLMYSGLKDILPSLKPPNQTNTRGFHVDNLHAMACFSMTCLDSLSFAVTSKLCL
jgi:hypothetical protein